MTTHQHRLGSPGRWRTCAAALLVAAAGMAACTEPITSPAPSERPSFAAGGLAVADVRLLQSLPGASNSFSVARDANDLGQIVGLSYSSAGLLVPVVWNAAGVPTELPPLVAGQGEAYALSDDGTVAAGYAFDGTNYRATRWIRSGASWAVDPLPLAVATDSCAANGTNADGSMIVGVCRNSALNYMVAVVWRSGFPEVLMQGTATDVNESDQVVGSSSSGQGLLWSLPGGFMNIGTLGGLASTPQAINESGDVVGYSDLADGVAAHAFLWNTKKGMIDLGALSGFQSVAEDVNDAAQVVGYFYIDLGGGNVTTHAALWAKGKGLDLGVPLGYTVSLAHAITNTGMIVGYVGDGSGNRAVAWQLK